MFPGGSNRELFKPCLNQNKNALQLIDLQGIIIN